VAAVHLQLVYESERNEIPNIGGFTDLIAGLKSLASGYGSMC